MYRERDRMGVGEKGEEFSRSDMGGDFSLIRCVNTVFSLSLSNGIG